MIETLINSLSKALVHYYPLAGRLCPIRGGRWDLNCNSKGALLLEASCQGTNLDDLGDFAPTQMVQQLMPKIEYGNTPLEDTPLLVVQITRFPCGGLTLGVAISRAVVDGVATMVFLNSWAKLARGESLGSTEIPSHDRISVLSCSPSEHNMLKRFHRAEFQAPPFWEGSLVDSKYETSSEVFKLTKDQVQKLKKRVLAGGFGNGNLGVADPQRPYTSFEVIGGLLWRCVCKARCVGNGDQPTRVSTLVNCRSRLKPPLPNAFFGCAALPTVTKTCTFDDIKNKPLSYAVGNIREALGMLTDEYIRSALDYIAEQKDVSLLRNTLHYTATSPEGQFRGNPNLTLVSWMNFSFQDADFGWGNPVYLGPGHINSDGKAFIMNDGNGDGFIVVICLLAFHMDALKKYFYEDVGEVFPSSKL